MTGPNEPNTGEAWFRGVVRERLSYLVDAFGFREAPEEDVEVAGTWTVSYLGPVGVRATWEPPNDVVELAIYILSDGAFPTLAPIIGLHIDWIVRVRSPGDEAKYRTLAKQRPLPIEAYLDVAAADLKAYASDLLTGRSFELVGLVRAELQRTLGGRGVRDVDWWVD